DQLKKLLDGLTTSFAQVASTISNSKNDLEEEGTVSEPDTLVKAIISACRVEVGEYYSKQAQERGYQRKLEEELGNLSQKIEKITLNYAILTEKRPKEYQDKKVGYISQNCISEKVSKKANEEK
ncbi:22763_t:CDS:2, partial [Gigaspora rosea]